MRTGEDNTHYILCLSGEEALKIAIKEEIALILLDVQMPGMDGFEVARLLKNNSRTSNIPIIFVTAIDHDHHKVIKGFESGAVDFLFKPLNPGITRAKVKAFIKIYLQNKELQQKNQLLKQSQDLVERVLDASLNAIWALKAIHNASGQIEDFEIVRVNQATRRILKRDPATLIGQRLNAAFPGLKAAGIFEYYVKVVETGEPLLHEQRFAFDEHEVWYAQQAVKLDTGLVVTFEDISRRKRAEEDLKKAHSDLLGLNNELEERVKVRTKDLMNTEKELRHTNDHLRRINADLDNFIYTASHDLKAPINNIEGLAILLKKRLPPGNEGIEELVKMMDHSIEKFKNALNDLTEVSKLEHAEFTDVEDIEIKLLIDEVKQNIKELIESNQARIIERLEVTSVRFSRKNLRSILYNLISNSIKYRSPDRVPQVDIHTFLHPSGNYKVLVVKDNGLGVSEEDIPKMFGMFKRLHSHVEGTGIGLYIVKKIVENMGGKIEVNSEPEQGTEFKIYFPVEQEANQ